MADLYFVETRGYIDSEDFECSISDAFMSYSDAVKYWKKECGRVVSSKMGWLNGWIGEDGHATDKFLVYTIGKEEEKKPLVFYIRPRSNRPKDKVKDYFVRIDLIVSCKNQTEPAAAEDDSATANRSKRNKKRV